MDVKCLDLTPFPKCWYKHHGELTPLKVLLDKHFNLTYNNWFKKGKGCNYIEKVGH